MRKLPQKNANVVNWERRWRKSGTEADKLQYADQCGRVRKLLKSSKMSYNAPLISENKSDSKVLFNTINRMLHHTPQNHYPSCGSPKELCDKFADFFCDNQASTGYVIYY